MGKTVKDRAAVLEIPIASQKYLLLLAVMSCGLVYALAGQAHSESGLIISKDGDNVNVNLDTEASANASIRRSDDVMIIRLPKSFSQKPLIDASLKKENVVAETETPEGRNITITSQQIYLTTPSKSAEANRLRTDRKTSLLEKTAWSAASLSAAGETSHFKKSLLLTGSATPIPPLSFEKATSLPLPKPNRALNQAIEKLKTETQLPSKQATESIGPTDITQKPSPEITPSVENQSTEAVPVSTPSDPETQPLDLEGTDRTMPAQAASGSLFRIGFSLLLVLGLLAAFIKMALPRLLERYPEFFENLKRQQQEKRDHFPAARQSSAPTLPTQMGSQSKKPYLERLNVNGEHFNVLTSATLGKGKELHLVEIKGRQFMVATTPYTVSLLKDLTDEDAAFNSALAFDVTLPALTDLNALKRDLPTPTEAPHALAETLSPIPKSNLYAGKPAASPINAANQLPLQAQAGLAHLKYTNPVASTAKNTTNPPPHAVASGETTSTVYADAEEVVVLADYDDTYEV